MQIYVHRNNQQLGPFTEAEVKAKLATGELSPQDPVWWEGQAGWAPLANTPLGGGVPLPPGTVGGETSQLAIWALVCGCLSLMCLIFTSIPAIVLGHMSLNQIKKNPALKGHGMALAGLIIGYVMTVFGVIYLSIVVISVLIALGQKVKEKEQSSFTPPHVQTVDIRLTT